jgi:hypothetical protein
MSLRSLSRWLLALLLLWSGLAAPYPAQAQNCTDDAELVDTQVDPAAASFVPDEVVTVTWTLRNTGDCTWDRSYRLRFVDGDELDGPRTARLRSRVAPGETLDVTLDLTAPAAPGDYAATWQLRDPNGNDFGPELEVALSVAGEVVPEGDVVLPEVLVFGGRGGGGDGDALYYCLDDGNALPEVPTLFVDDSIEEYRYATLYLCSLEVGTEVEVTLVNPQGEVFARSYVEDEPATYVGDGQEFTGTVLVVPLSWLTAAPAGEWIVNIAGGGLDAQFALSVPVWEEPVFEPTEFVTMPYPSLDNWPLAPIDPFAAAEGCNYTYDLEQEMRVGGRNLPPNTTVHLGIYQDRLGEGYFVAQVPVQTDANGELRVDLVTPAEPGEYTLVGVVEVDPAGYQEDGTAYEFGMTDDLTAWGCFTVMDRHDADGLPWRLAFATGHPGRADIVVLDMNIVGGYYPTTSWGECDASSPAWWPDGEWVVYQSDCVPAEELALTRGDNYDLYAHQIDFTYTLAEEEKLVRLTATPDLDETEPAVDLDGRIVYRQAPAGSDPEASGELWILDVLEEENYPLGLTGRAPAFSPDGSRVAFMSDLEGSWQVYVYDLEQEEVRRVSTNCATHCRFPAWSPDGRQVIYSVSASGDDLTSAGLWIAAAAGGLPRRWLSGAYDRPSWSAEGWITFNGEGGIYRAQARNPEPVRYLYQDPEQGTYHDPAWTR